MHNSGRRSGQRVTACATRAPRVPSPRNSVSYTCQGWLLVQPANMSPVTDHLIGVLGLYGGTLVVCFLSGLIPVINAELFLVGVSKFAVSSPAQLPGVVI